MNFELSEEQQMLKGMARDFLTANCPKTLVKQMEDDERGFPAGLWREMADLGWMGLALPEKYAGSGMKFLDLGILLEEMGRACLPGPFFSSVVLGALPILDLGTDEQRQEFLPRIAGGKMIFTMALTEPDADLTLPIKTKALPAGNDYIINGTKLFVPDANMVDYLLCVTGGEGPDQRLIFILDEKSPGITLSLLKTMAGDKQCEVVFNQVKAAEESLLGGSAHDSKAVEHLIERAAAAKCFETIGGIQQVLEMTIEYAKTRKQFGRSIGSFEVIKHYCADMAIEVDGARFVTYQAGWRLSEGLPCRKEIAIARAGVSDICRHVLALAHQIHGAIGITMDHNLQYYTRRIRASESSFGDTAFWREIVAQETL